MKTLTKNTAASLAATVVAILCGLILPREILLHYGSEMNGLANSARQFLQFSVVLELGLGAVVPAALYRPLAERDFGKISAIMSSAYRFYRRLAGIVAAYLALLIVVFPRLTNSAFSWEVSAGMLVCVGLGFVAQYWAGIPERFLLVADQKGYVTYLLTIASALLTTAAELSLIHLGCSLAVVRLAGSLVSVGCIVFLCRYVARRYPVDHRTSYADEPIPQKWNGIAQHIAYIILEYTDVIVISLFLPLREVSVYSVYFMVIFGIRRLFNAVTFSVQPRLGALWAAEKKADLNRFFRRFECVTHLAAVLLFSCTGLLIVPFVKLYTAGVTDTQYARPLFAALLTLAYGMQGLRDPYDRLIIAAGHFRQTQGSYIVAACLNLGLSLLAVRLWGLPGVAAGTLAAMTYQTLYMTVYVSRALLDRPLKVSALQLLTDAAAAGIILAVAGRIHFETPNYFSWVCLGCAVFAVSAAVTAAAAFVLLRPRRGRR